MKKKDKQELHSLSDSELQKKEAELKDMLAKHMTNKYTKPVKNVREVAMWRKTIAMIQTIKREREIQKEG